MQNPNNAQRPQVIDAAFRRYLEALQVENIEELLPPTPPVENLDNQLLENMLFILPPNSGPMFDVFPEQNHAIHLAQMADLDQYLMGMTPEQQQAVFTHKQKHEGYLYGQLNGLVPPPPPESVPTAPFGARQNVPMDDVQAGGAIPGLEAQSGGLDMGGAEPKGGGAEGFGGY